MPAPETRYARSGDVNIAYQVTGRAGPDLVFVPGWVSHIEEAWEEATLSVFLERPARFSRLILLDRRGTGLSDPVDRLPTLEERIDDLRAVMDAAGSRRAYLFGISESGPMTTLFAASHPARTAGIRCAAAIRDAIAPLGLGVRAGLHTGECEELGGKRAGIAVHLGARICALAEPNEVLVSSTVKDLVAGSGLRFRDRGLHAPKGIGAAWRLNAAEA